MQMDAGLDTGAMLLRDHVALTPRTTATTLHDDLAAMGAADCRGPAPASHPGTPQPDTGVTYVQRLSREDGRIDWRTPATTIDRQIRALTRGRAPLRYWTARSSRSGRRKSHRAAHGQSLGTVMDDRLHVACGDGTILRITRLQRPGRGMMEAGDFLRGQAIAPGTRLGMEQPDA
ncbi:hypothetical protein RAA17_07815 [Komagataeibacter rhaeticus]|nr:hypothetical protein [Komagataeibacter rhaeticus]